MKYDLYLLGFFFLLGITPGVKKFFENNRIKISALECIIGTMFFMVVTDGFLQMRQLFFELSVGAYFMHNIAITLGTFVFLTTWNVFVKEIDTKRSAQSIPTALIKVFSIVSMLSLIGGLVMGILFLFAGNGIAVEKRKK